MAESKAIAEEAVTDSNDISVVQDAVDASATSKRAKWQVSLIAGAGACIVVLVINLGVTIWSTVRLQSINPRFNGSHRKVIYEGSCSASRTINVVIHLVINIFSSVLLAASNYGMQCLSAPTRADVDRAHGRRSWMDIGIPSFRNIRMVSRARGTLWFLLFLSSIPLHLLYVSQILMFTSIDEELKLLWSNSGFYNDDPKGDEQMVARLMAGEFGKLDNLTTLQCINEYAVPFQTKRDHVLLVVTSDGPVITGSESPKQPLQSTSCDHRAGSTYDWICGDGLGCSTCRSKLTKIRSQSNNWSPRGKRVKYCLSQPAEQACRLNFDIRIAVVILAFNFVKAVALAFIALRPPKEPLFVLGDAVESFLISPDETTTGACLASARMVRAGHFYQPCTIGSRCRYRAIAVTKTRWSWSILIYGVTFCAACSLLGWGLRILPGPRDLRSLWDLGLGSLNELTLIRALQFNAGSGDLYAAGVLLTNLPQLVFSFLYFQYNGIFTCMAAAEEWSGYGNKPKSLRVSSHPRGDQRSRYFLQLPYRYSVPLLLVSILMHWMLSQCFFIVAVEKEGFWKLLTCGYSPIAIVFAITTTAFMGAAVIITATRRLPTTMPVVGSCSLAIAAACHHPDNTPQPDASVFPLQWGVMWRQREGSGMELTNHCGFSQYPVEKPRWGIVYR
ncbi:uncharacterized protein B0J16DRAFT_266395 [Fusarium flagelliforme]|uniref:uncharacterized protein n=1 Tax=Fusarium flagelliforme TaxID=2675880 RepID=UPI001E8CB141|nr:uncharacterized protein B0J16DRAFT_266395 [Fusarium flagelliforme]KAH7184595.1 hypothetical protein B0J16DRAFT_266395 [Fusarium flagelliforme]